MNPLALIAKYYPIGSPQYTLLVAHSECVRDKALAIVAAHPELGAEAAFVAEAAMLHDIGVYRTTAPSIHCHGTLPYICHGVEGSTLLQAEGYPHHALVCERHTGTGLSLEDIVQQQLPIPHRDMRPQNIEEMIICYADKFYSKGGDPLQEKPIERIRTGLARYGERSVAQFDQWHKQFAL